MTKIIKRPTDEPESASPLPAPGKIIDREVIEAADRARRIIEAAKAQADQILLSAQEVRDKTLQEGRQAGYEKGMAEWLAQIQRVQEGMKGLVEQAKPQVIRLAIRVAEKIVRQKLEASPELLVGMVDEAIRSLRGQQQMRIILRVHPQDKEILEARRQKWLERNPFLGSLDIVPDDTLQRGGCRIETEFGMVDTTIETQIRVMERHLLGEAESSTP
ncbi:MAG: type III secretion system stator protein SctL [Acidobacteriota bacterium]